MEDFQIIYIQSASVELNWHTKCSTCVLTVISWNQIGINCLVFTDIQTSMDNRLNSQIFVLISDNEVWDHLSHISEWKSDYYLPTSIFVDALQFLTEEIGQ